MDLTSHFTGKDSWTYFKLLQSNTGTSFLATNPKLWRQKSDCLEVKAIIKTISVVNDASEWALGLLTEFHDKLTCNSTAKQNIFEIRKGLREKQGSVAISQKERLKREWNNTSTNHKSDAHMVSVLPLLCYTLILFVESIVNKLNMCISFGMSVVYM